MPLRLGRRRINTDAGATPPTQYGLTPTMRYEFMRLMTRSALVGLSYTERAAGASYLARRASPSRRRGKWGVGGGMS